MLSSSSAFLITPSAFMLDPYRPLSASLPSSPRQILSTMSRLEQEMDRMLDSVMDVTGGFLLPDEACRDPPASPVTNDPSPSDGEGGGAVMRLRPHFDIQSTSDRLLVTAATPGLAKDDIAVEVLEATGDVPPTLVISGRSSSKQTSEEPARVQASYAAFEKRVSLPPHTKPDMVEAKYDNGVLRVSVKRPEEELQAPPRHRIPLL
ncbi:hypothetical protein GUITHDRAFT_104494 [Guillardia theta CCMP2712]|nr:hypothetical protein GUITHDRAFT_104492 [Guillardia theta CCMP2712]XP_005836512.1 hypothetical protein GUITHDRAFT_104494 [Guillardia theta CCMP2712]EKX49530.1 hypothetical protein GUITHDRAFT_104492 [Guillardia theta CCMP2712]EKX49532.1 hypothetical protein GUITHDRAFT_104494 [Guillardia theta CCMP2712]|eukprot:XP_005836510.1 hypothetical protein GUITHDRAFT_104492 [Guillardia theta CCMP2712]